MKDETLLPDDFDFDRFNDVVWLEVIASNPRMHSITASTIAMVALELNRRLGAALQSGNSAQPVTVPAGYVLVPVDPTITMTEALWDEIHESRDMNNAYRAMLAAAPKAPDSQLTPAPEDRLQKAIVDACMVFLHGCDSLSKNYECDFSDSETETWFCIANVAKKIGVVEETGNRRWSLSQQMRGEIEEVYRKYAMRIMEAAPKVKP